MATASHTIEIDRSPAEVFALATDLARWPEWQEEVTRVTVEGAGGLQVGTRMHTTRKFGFRHMTMGTEVTTLDAPRAFAFRGIDGPVRGSGRVVLESLDDGARTRMTFELDFEGRGFGKLLVPLARRQASGQMARSHLALKQILEHPVASAAR
jgi:uncharacterized protein YndB with AHSA1/START domain